MAREQTVLRERRTFFALVVRIVERVRIADEANARAGVRRAPRLQVAVELVGLTCVVANWYVMLLLWGV